MTSTETRILQTHLTLLTHDLDRGESEYTLGALTELKIIIKQTGGRIVNGVVTYDN